jgi:hypothetical protein
MGVLISQPFCKCCGEYMYNYEGNTLVVCYNCFEINSIFELDENAVALNDGISMLTPRGSANCIRMNKLRADYKEKTLYDKAIEEYVQTLSS